MSERKWTLVDFENCDACGDDVECLTDCNDFGEKGEQQFWDGDECRCVKCGEKGIMIADGERAYVSWEESK